MIIRLSSGAHWTRRIDLEIVEKIQQRHVDVIIRWPNVSWPNCSSQLSASLQYESKGGMHGTILADVSKIRPEIATIRKVPYGDRIEIHGVLGCGSTASQSEVLGQIALQASFNTTTDRAAGKGMVF